ncbi:MAG: hypothetical protein QXK12_06595, partial [Candidatus Nezhaarchaeales archaeon]
TALLTIKGKAGVPNRYVDVFCGRIPRGILAEYYTDFSLKRLKEVYDRANLNVLTLFSGLKRLRPA